uniref:REF/SRPP-like protein n=1 Tax=Chenopodium quinoa TaxID=63459 RepID=A0A803M6N8_CHEQI
MEKSDEMKKNEQQELKHLGFVRAAAINTIVWLTNLYDYAKINSGPLRSAVGTVEGAVTTVVTPVYNKFKDVDVASAKFDEHAPPLAKQVVTQVNVVIDQTTQLAKEVVHQAQVGGPLAAAQYAANESKELVLCQSVKIWSKLDKFPPIHMVAEMTVPTAAHWSEKYNKTISELRGKGYDVFSYVPLIPIDEISKAFKQSKGGNEGEVDPSAREVAASQ